MCQAPEGGEWCMVGRESGPGDVCWGSVLSSSGGYSETQSRKWVAGLRAPVWTYREDCSDTLDCSPPGSSDYGISQARMLEWVAISSSNRSYWPRDRNCVSCSSCIGRQILYHWATREAQYTPHLVKSVQDLRLCSQAFRNCGQWGINARWIMRCGGHDANMVIVVYITEFIQCAEHYVQCLICISWLKLYLILTFLLILWDSPHFADG